MLPLAHAGDIGTVNQTMTLFADVLTTPSYYPANGANITVRNSTGAIVVNNLRMAELLPGLYAYNFTPNTTGQYYTISSFENTTSVIGSASSTFYILEPSVVENEAMSGITTLIALGLVAALLLVLAFKMDKEYAWMRNILVVFSFLMIVGIAATALLHKDSCGLITVNGALVKQCVSTATTTSVEWWLFVISISILSLVVAAIIVGLFIKALKSFVDSGQKLQ